MIYNEKILVVQTAFIGDAVLTLPMIQKLHELFPSSEIDVVAIPSTAEIFTASPFVNTVLVLHKRGEHKSFISFLRFCRGIKNSGYTRIYSPHRSFRSSLLVFLSRVKETYGFDKNSLRHIYKNLVVYNGSHHEVQRNLHLAGVNSRKDEWKILPVIDIPGEIKSKTDTLFKSNGIPQNDNLIAIAPGSVWNTKKYPPEYFEEVIKYLVNNNYFILLIGGEKDQKLCEETALKVKRNIISFAGKISLIESIEILKRCRMLLCNDSAPTHLAMCADITVLTIYCSTIAGFGFYPYSHGSSFISYDDLFCKPCGIHGHNECPIKSFECGYNLKPDLLIKKAEEMLNAV